MEKALNILASPLDWGLGHATRMLPLLRYLQQEGHHLHIGVNELTLDLLKEQLPEANFHYVPSYQIRYSNSAYTFSMLSLIPRILRAKKKEYRWVQDFVKDKPIDLIISDSRFGFYHPHIPSVIISHQLRLQYPKYYLPLAWLAQRNNERYLKKFQQIWVPDFEDHLLSGKLSENSSLKAYYISPQSRLQPCEKASPLDKSYVLCILSGPEPERSVLEELLIKQAASINKHLVMIGGRPFAKNVETHDPNLTYFNHLNDVDMACYIQYADLVISRSGYSSIMDYYQLQSKRLFLIPTPGQTEQLYLAQHLKKMHICDFAEQKEFNLQLITEKAFFGEGFKASYHKNVDFDILIAALII